MAVGEALTGAEMTWLFVVGQFPTCTPPPG
jgi:hypothetical protein